MVPEASPLQMIAPLYITAPEMQAPSKAEMRTLVWFPTASFSGKTIKTASLTLMRQNGSGKGSAVTLTLYGITVASASGNPHTGKVSYGVIGVIDNGETKTFTLPTAAGQAMASGTIKGFMLYANDGGVMSGKSYSTNYCKISSNGAAEPKLTITY